MNTRNETNLKHLLSNTPVNVVLTSKYLAKAGFSHDLQKIYERSGWLTRLYEGAYVKLGEKIDINGALYALQEQLGLSIHIGGISALNEYYNARHNISFNTKYQLIGTRGEKLPKWFISLYSKEIEFNRTTFLPEKLSLIEQKKADFSIKIPTLERALLEMLYLVPQKVTLNEAYQIIETIVVAKPKEFQVLLEQCTSIKVKRLFLYIVEKINHPWFKKIDLTKIDLGKGTREITKGGIYNKQYNIIIGNIEGI